MLLRNLSTRSLVKVFRTKRTNIAYNPILSSVKNNNAINQQSIFSHRFHSGTALLNESGSGGLSLDDVLLTPVCAKRINTLNLKSGTNQYLRISVESGGVSFIVYVYKYIIYIYIKFSY
jgi:hypothetical protein